MQQRLPSLFKAPILFAHRGASAHVAENTLDAFQLAIKLGATGLETDCWVTSDQIVVLDHDGQIKGSLKSKFRSIKISTLTRAEIPKHIPTLVDLLECVPLDLPISIDVCDPAAMQIIAALAENICNPGRIYICHPSLDLLSSWKESYPRFKYVNSIRLHRITEGPERRCANLSKFGIDALNMHHSDWNGGLTSLAHRFNIAAFSWDLQHADQLRTALLMGVDAVFSDWPDRAVDAYASIF